MAINKRKSSETKKADLKTRLYGIEISIGFVVEADLQVRLPITS